MQTPFGKKSPDASSRGLCEQSAETNEVDVMRVFVYILILTSANVVWSSCYAWYLVLEEHACIPVSHNLMCENASQILRTALC
jgi:hypothetical protein